jgi:uncharacterized protein YehS (DUF1456 family)
MNYDTVIVEMLSRIQALEEQVAELKSEQKKEAEKEMNKVSTADIRMFIDGLINEAENRGEDSITIKALDIHNAMGLTSRYPMVCNAMRQCMKDGDQVIFETQSGYSSTLEIMYLCKKN